MKSEIINYIAEKNKKQKARQPTFLDLLKIVNKMLEGKI